MMRKGVSPVVATVLLIAIAVISAVAVWYWVAPMTGSQPTPSTIQYGFAVTAVYTNSTSGTNCVTVDLKNTGGVTIPVSTVFEVRYQTNGSIGAVARYVNVTSALAPGASSNFYIVSAPMAINKSQVEQGTYILRASATLSIGSVSGYSDVYFTC